MTFIFRNRTIFWDISKWNRGQKKWDGGSMVLTFEGSQKKSQLMYMQKVLIYTCPKQLLHTGLCGCKNKKKHVFKGHIQCT